MVYGRKLEIYGPIYESHKIEGDKVRVSFTHIGKGLAWQHGEKLQGFAVAGDDPASLGNSAVTSRKWYWADAVIDGETVVLSSDKVEKPVAISYAWGKDYPWANLFNKDRLPAIPFRIEVLEGSSHGASSGGVGKMTDGTSNKPMKATNGTSFKRSPFVIVMLMLVVAGHVCRAQPEPAHRGTHLYQPPGGRVHDPWLVNVDGTVHLFHLPDAWHATSRDCVFWEPHRAILANSAFTAAERNYNTEPEVWTGCAVQHEGKIYLFWTGNMGVNRRLCNRICLSISSDGGKTFTHHPDNPIIKPDPRWYDTEDDPAPEYPYHGKTHNWSGGVDGKMALMDWRDIAIIKDPKTGLFHGYIVARLRGRKNDKESACIARVSSKDLVHWEVHPPVFNPGIWGLHEVPDVFQLGGKWYLTAMATYPREGVYHGDDPLLRWGHLVGESDTPEGPFRLVKDNCVMAGVDQGKGYYSMRTVEFKGERLAFACGDKLSLAVKLVPREGGGLQDVWWPANERLFGEKRGLALRDAPGQPTIEAPPRGDDSFMITADIELGTASAAGITFRKADGGQPHTLFLDSKRGCFEWVGGDTPGTGRIAARTWPIKPGGKHTIRVINIEQHVVVYLDDRYVMNGRGLKFETAGLALTSVGGKARLRDIQYWGPKKGTPNPLPVGVGAAPEPAVFN